MPAFGASGVRTRLRLTRRGRVVLTGLAAVPIVIAVLVGALSSGGAVAGIDDGGAPVAFETIVVGAGDTLWGIAETIAPSEDPREVILEIMRLNGLATAVVQPGQELALPVVD
ncbi:LysM peptidoglycan-binding domain-containing protein [Agromyces sp. C10]|uniref:LysM peptidoglycan-binding domain-containing protein n=1 Tax=Agromyces sp. C10 TaxID=2935077 RepID=UPI00200B2B31|nr:LysM peptidoglycan-binding domain-containing protein [Agromyces sp. C10]